MTKLKSKYISLQDATKYCGYSQEYLSLRARQGKLKAVKFGRNWATTRVWLNSYLKQVNNYKNNNKKQKPELRKSELSDIYKVRPIEVKPQQMQTSKPARNAPATTSKMLAGAGGPNIVKQNLQRAAVAIAVSVLFFAGGVFVFQQIENNPVILSEASALAGQAKDFIIESNGILHDVQNDIEDVSDNIERMFNYQKTTSTYFLASTIDVLKNTFTGYSQWIKFRASQTKKSWAEAICYVFEDIEQAAGFIARPWQEEDSTVIINEDRELDVNMDAVGQIELKDKITGEPYCIFIEDGELQVIRGVCIDFPNFFEGEK